MGKRKQTRVGGNRRAFTLAREAYRQRGKPSGGMEPGMQFLTRTPTEVAYLDPATNTIHVGVRGTADAMDVLTWPTIPLGKLSSTSRYKRARAFVDTLAKQYPTARIEVAGHSLGGTIATQLKRDMPDRVAEVHAFNQAVQPGDVLGRLTGQDKGVNRYYVGDDPLYQYEGGKLLAGTTTMFPASGAGGVGGHFLENFYPELAQQMDQANTSAAAPAAPASWTNWAGRKLAQVNQGLSYFGVPGTAEAATQLYMQHSGAGGRARRGGRGRR